MAHFWNEIYEESKSDSDSFDSIAYDLHVLKTRLSRLGVACEKYKISYVYCLCFNMVSFGGQKKAWATPRSVSFRGFIENF